MNVTPKMVKFIESIEDDFDKMSLWELKEKAEDSLGKLNFYEKFLILCLAILKGNPLGVYMVLNVRYSKSKRKYLDGVILDFGLYPKESMGSMLFQFNLTGFPGKKLPYPKTEELIKHLNSLEGFSWGKMEEFRNNIGKLIEFVHPDNVTCFKKEVD